MEDEDEDEDEVEVEEGRKGGSCPKAPFSLCSLWLRNGRWIPRPGISGV